MQTVDFTQPYTARFARQGNPAMLHIVPCYAAVLALLFVVLSIRTIRVRRSLKIAIGDAGNPVMARAMRVHANFAEYVPFALLLMVLVELQGAPAWALHALGVALLLARLSHAYGVSQAKENYAFRIVGVVTTFAVFGLCAAALLWLTK